jgi:hypothetical protein
VRVTADEFVSHVNCIKYLVSNELRELFSFCGQFKELGHKRPRPFEFANPPGKAEENNEQYTRNLVHPVPRLRLEPHIRLNF